MLRRCQLSRCLVQYAALSATAGKLNTLLEIPTKGQRTPREVLKQFIRAEVMPLLRGTTLDRRHDSAEVRRSLSQLLRDASFAAVVLHASPSGAYVSTLVECIKHDHTRMQFIHKMTSNQASRVIQHLCRLGVRDGGVYAPLVARLDFNVLKEVARAMFALNDEGLYQETVSLIVPLYCGETWVPVFEGGEGYTKLHNKSCNVFDAVRLLSVLSKSVRGVVEQRRRDEAGSAAAHPLPVESIQRLRTNLTVFIVQNESLLRGGHWINFTRAMVHFPHELKTMKYLEQHLVVVQAVDALQLPHRVARRRLSDVLETDDLAAFGMDRVFLPVERQQCETSWGGKGQKNRFDVPSIDLAKLLSIIEQVPLPKAVQQRRLEIVIRAIVDDMDSLSFADLVRFLHALRQIEGSAPFASTLDAATAAISRTLAEEAGATHTRIPYVRLVQLATLINAFRVKSCRGFVTYLDHFLPTMRFMSVEDATSFMNALAAIGEVDGVELCAHVGAQILDKVSLDGDGDSTALLLSYPLSCTKLLRGAVLLGTAPSSDAVVRIFGGSGKALKVSSALRAAGASVLFDVARSLYHFCRMKKPLDAVWEEMLWSHGVVGALLPLLAQLTCEFRDELVAAGGVSSRRATYVPLAWRSTMEAVFPYVDVNLDVVSLPTMQQRIGEIFPFCREILTMAIGIAAMQRQALQQGRQVEPLAFSSNGIVHLMSFVLMFEHLLYHGTWQAEIGGGAAAGAGAREKMRALKEDYNSLLTAPVGVEDDGKGVTAITLMNGLFPSKGEQGAPRRIFDRGSILEITTNLPFAVSLAVSQGPINELFCERAVAAMVGGDG
ncbi:hypothetical protein DQ04_00911060 [Trypanosoma grayi]|uniref:hypothetical protein n=1 Tax=Trypanosoma grayi TaxID=71804 RepID=UPI0004F462DE|nr:hypothetical protein DQ04_00911060 [Trypanosoma grayi]KEG13594.1 hypothetical protein DQ04_00911060 [Trypanosoma grayi]